MAEENAVSILEPKANADYLLTTKLFCGHCGSNMVGECGTSRNGETHYYYKCTNRKRSHSCTKHTERKEWIEEFVVRHTVNTVLTDDNIELIATKAAELMEKEFAESSVLATLEQTKKDIDRRIKNMIDLMEQGIVTPSTRERLLELESQKTDLEHRMARETMKKPPLSKERILHWLYSFKGGNINDMEYRQRVIDTLVNSIYVYDNDGGNSRKIVFTFNISGQNTSVVNCSDIACFAPPSR